MGTSQLKLPLEPAVAQAQLVLETVEPKSRTYRLRRVRRHQLSIVGKEQQRWESEPEGQDHGGQRRDAFGVNDGRRSRDARCDRSHRTSHYLKAKMYFSCHWVASPPRGFTVGELSACAQMVIQGVTLPEPCDSWVQFQQNPVTFQIHIVMHLWFKEVV